MSMPWALKWPFQLGSVSRAVTPELVWPWPILLRKPRELSCWPVRTPASFRPPAAGSSSGSSAKADPATAAANSPAHSAWYNLVIVVYSGMGENYGSVQLHTPRSRINHFRAGYFCSFPQHRDYWQCCCPAGTSSANQGSSVSSPQVPVMFPEPATYRALRPFVINAGRDSRSRRRCTRQPEQSARSARPFTPPPPSELLSAGP